MSWLPDTSSHDPNVFTSRELSVLRLNDAARFGANKLTRWSAHKVQVEQLFGLARLAGGKGNRLCWLSFQDLR
jgi:hypothetical protein